MSFEDWYRSSVYFHALTHMIYAATCILLVLLGVMIAIADGAWSWGPALFCSLALVSGLLAWVAYTRIAVVHVLGEQIVVHQRRSEIYLGWDEVISISRYTTTGLGPPYLFRMKIVGRKRAFWFIEPFNVGWPNRQFTGWVDMDYLATTDRSDWELGD